MHNPTHGTCEDPCADGFYNNGSICAPCDASCLTCSAAGVSSCLKCASPRGLSAGGQCVEDCGNKFYISEGKCQECHSTCLRCFGHEASQCSACVAPRKHVTGLNECVEVCPE